MAGEVGDTEIIAALLARRRPGNDSCNQVTILELVNVNFSSERVKPGGTAFWTSAAGAAKLGSGRVCAN